MSIEAGTRAAEVAVEAVALQVAELEAEQGSTDSYVLKGDDLERLTAALGRPYKRAEASALLYAIRALLPGA